MEVHVTPWLACSRVSPVAETRGLAHLLRNAFKQLRDKNLKWKNDHFFFFLLMKNVEAITKYKF